MAKLRNRGFCLNHKTVWRLMKLFSLFGQKLYLSVNLDLHRSYLISYAISERSVLNLVTSMLDKAFEVIPMVIKLIFHSHQGWRYQNKYYCQMLKEKGIQQSMIRKGICFYNAVMENFFRCSKAHFSISRSFNLWNTSSRNWWNIWIIITTAESKQGERPCRLQFTDKKPFFLLE